jgi:hypothetical protein
VRVQESPGLNVNVTAGAPAEFTVMPGHGRNSWFFHFPNLFLSIGHFYLAKQDILMWNSQKTIDSNPKLC